MRLTVRGHGGDTRSSVRAEPDRDLDEEDATPSRWVRAGTVCAVGLGATLLACTVIVFTGHGQHDDSASPAPAYPTAAAHPGSPVPTSATTGTGTAAGSVPADVTWRQVGLGALPFSASAGPQRVSSGVPSDFTDSEPGAVLAATQILGRLSWAATSATEMRAVADAMTTPSAQARAALTYGPPSDPALIPQLAGYQILTYTPDAALINLALRFHATLRVVPAALSFTGGDWRLAGAPGPLAQSNWAALDDLTGYVLFSGQPTTGH